MMSVSLPAGRRALPATVNFDSGLRPAMFSSVPASGLPEASTTCTVAVFAVRISVASQQESHGVLHVSIGVLSQDGKLLSATVMIARFLAIGRSAPPTQALTTTASPSFAVFFTASRSCAPAGASATIVPAGRD